MPKKKKKKIENPFTPLAGHECDSGDFESLVREYFKGKPFVSREEVRENFSFEADQLVGHDETCSFSPDGNYDEDELEEVLSGSRYEYCTDILLNKMVADGFLPKGEYYIETC